MSSARYVPSITHYYNFINTFIIYKDTTFSSNYQTFRYIYFVIVQKKTEHVNGILKTEVTYRETAIQVRF